MWAFDLKHAGNVLVSWPVLLTKDVPNATSIWLLMASCQLVLLELLPSTGLSVTD